MNKNIPFFSVIVPVYKVEPYLHKCINSIINQTFKNFELILIDDGSPDSCPEICESFAAIDKRIKVIHKSNGGSADARNFGLLTMSYDNNKDCGYIIFIDSDDFFCDNTTFQQIYDRIIHFQEDMILYGCKTIYLDGKEKISRNNYPIDILNTHNIDNSLKALYISNNFPGAAWIYSIKRSIIKDNNLKFTKGITGEDYEWIISCIIHSNSIGAIKGIHYAYIKREGSITSKSRISAFWGLRATIEKYFSYNRRYRTLDTFLGKIYLLTIMSYNNLPRENKKEAKDILKKYLPVLLEIDFKFYYFFIKILGFRFTSVIIRLIYNIIR